MQILTELSGRTIDQINDARAQVRGGDLAPLGNCCSTRHSCSTVPPSPL